jgi:hypothetical protein
VGDIAWGQYILKDTAFYVEVVASYAGTDYPITTTKVYTDADGNEYYNFHVPTSQVLTDGCVEIAINVYDGADALVRKYLSEPFQVDNEQYLRVEWYGNSRSYDDRLYWSTTWGNQLMRVRGRTRDSSTINQKTIYNNSEYDPVTLLAKPITQRIITIDFAPFYIVEKINIGMNHDKFIVNLENLNGQSPLTVTAMQGGNLMYSATATLTLID